LRCVLVRLSESRAIAELDMPELFAAVAAVPDDALDIVLAADAEETPASSTAAARASDILCFIGDLPLGKSPRIENAVHASDVSLQSRHDARTNAADRMSRRPLLLIGHYCS
jgi:hypothetical protein